MSRPKQPSETVLKWLQCNLGRHATAPLTGTDALALFAAVQIASLASQTGINAVARAWNVVVNQMQESTRELAYHSTAHALDWSHRGEMWHAAGFDPMKVRQCSFEPGGSHIDLSVKPKK